MDIELILTKRENLMNVIVSSLMIFPKGTDNALRIYIVMHSSVTEA